MAAPTQVGTAQSAFSNNSPNPLVVALPAGVQTGDLLVAVVRIWQAASPVITTPAGWTRTINGTTLFGGYNDQERLYVFTKVAGASEANPSFAFTGSGNGSAYMHGLLVAYRGQDPVTPLDGVASAAAASAGATIAVPAITTSVPNSLVLHVGVAVATTGVTITADPTGDSLIGDHYDTGPQIDEIRITGHVALAAGVVAADSYSRSSTTYKSLGATLAIKAPLVASGGGSMGGCLAALCG